MKIDVRVADDDTCLLCPDFEIKTDIFWANCEPYERFFYCTHFEKCERIKRITERKACKANGLET